jgi:prepilin-type N-terminal cleavage/methylation domain-containing protein
MKTEFKAKFLQHVAKRKREEGFTLIELLVVIIIIGILSAIALPSFLNQANKAKESEAKQYLASLNKGQQASYTENSQFQTEIDALGVGIKTQTENYAYACPEAEKGKASVNCQATPENASVRAYLGAVYLVQAPDEAGGEATSRSILCEGLDPGEAPGSTGAVDEAYQAGADPKCSEDAGMTDV